MDIQTIAATIAIVCFVYNVLRWLFPYVRGAYRRLIAYFRGLKDEGEKGHDDDNPG